MASWDTEVTRHYLAPLGLGGEWLCQWVTELMNDQGWTLHESAAYVSELLGRPRVATLPRRETR